MSISPLTPTRCEHSHFFDVPFCKNQTLIKKIGTIALHILTLGIPYIVCRVIPYCGAKIASGVKYAFHLIAGKGVESAHQNIVGGDCNIPIALKRRIALDFAREQLKSDPVDTQYGNSAPQDSVKAEIAAFRGLLVRLLTKYRSSSGEEKLEVASSCLKVCYALCSLKKEVNPKGSATALLMTMDNDIKNRKGYWSALVESGDFAGANPVEFFVGECIK